MQIRARTRMAPDPEVQRAYFGQAQAERFRWATGAPGFAETEDELLRPGGRLLGALLPRSRWTYLLVTARRAGSSP